MPMIKRFEDIRAWASARELVNLVYEISKEKPFSNDFALRDQLRRASISVMSNIAEGFDAGYRPEFIRFLRLAFRSASEAQSQLYTALDQKYVSKIEFDSAYEKATEVKKQINLFVGYLVDNKRGKFKGLREETTEYGIYSSGREIEFNVPDELFKN